MFAISARMRCPAHQRRASGYTEHQHITRRQRHEVRHVGEQAMATGQIMFAVLVCCNSAPSTATVIARCRAIQSPATTTTRSPGWRALRLEAHRRTIKALVRHAEIHHHRVTGDAGAAQQGDRQCGR